MIKNSKHTIQMLLVMLIVFIIGMSAKANNKQANYDSFLRNLYSMASKHHYTRALKKISKVDAKKMNQKTRDALALLKGRIYFNLKQYQKSLASYKQIEKKSEVWLSSVEERMWAKIHLGQFNEALADSHTVMSSLFSDSVSPEAYHASAFVAYQVCDFNRVFKVIDQFKKNSATKIKKLEAQNSTDHVARWSLKHYSEVIKELHLIEADAIQRLYLDQSLAGNRNKAGRAPLVGKYDLQFPYDENDIWIDEIDQLKVDAKNCPKPPKKVVSL